jgi:hypothetical protein
MCLEVREVGLPRGVRGVPPDATRNARADPRRACAGKDRSVEREGSRSAQAARPQAARTQAARTQAARTQPARRSRSTRTLILLPSTSRPSRNWLARSASC